MSVMNGPLFVRITDDVHLYSTSGRKCLAASSSSVGSPVVVDDVDPTNELQLWKLTAADDLCWLSPAGSSMTELGFTGDYAIPGMSLGLEPAHDEHTMGDKFSITRVPFCSD